MMVKLLQFTTLLLNCGLTAPHISGTVKELSLQDKLKRADNTS